MKIYTKTGDDGQTGLVGGARISKASARIHAIGEVDELNAALGRIAIHGEAAFEPSIQTIQSRLFDLGAELASPPEGRIQYSGLTDEDVTALERSIDEQTASLPPLRNFILPGGSLLAADLHFARAVCRRAERAVLALHDESPLRDVVLRFLNRLSDWLFVAARTANVLAGVSDVAWKGKED